MHSRFFGVAHVGHLCHGFNQVAAAFGLSKRVGGVGGKVVYVKFRVGVKFNVLAFFVFGVDDLKDAKQSRVRDF